VTPNFKGRYFGAAFVNASLMACASPTLIPF
jgi:hypothetical protein